MTLNGVTKIANGPRITIPKDAMKTLNLKIGDNLGYKLLKEGEVVEGDCIVFYKGVILPEQEYSKLTEKK